ncbi:hypothetical protein CEXT_789791 [Caerostris extrusa]|uniref:Uncharacterized protein n=1 Tax=Caerostris extrusa TaxID=172846 RepID=A0AAV4YFJ6_CAEEX|nr:hypothetical protein CEXT_789791 [Caerostris extrusa]
MPSYYSRLPNLACSNRYSRHAIQFLNEIVSNFIQLLHTLTCRTTLFYHHILEANQLLLHLTSGLNITLSLRQVVLSPNLYRKMLMHLQGERDHGALLAKKALHVHFSNRFIHSTSAKYFNEPHMGTKA